MGQSLEGDSDDPNVPGAKGTGGTGVQGLGLLVGVHAVATIPITNFIAVKAEGGGLAGLASPPTFGVVATTTGTMSTAVSATAENGGTAGYFNGPVFVSGDLTVFGKTEVKTSTTDGVAVMGSNTSGEGCRGFLGGINHNGEQTGVYGEGWRAVIGEARGPNSIGVVGNSGGMGVLGWTSASSGVAVQAENHGGGLAGKFLGNVEIWGDLAILGGKDIRLADLAEDFDRSNGADIEPGRVVVLSDAGTVHESHIAYDKKVAGVVSGAGNFRSAITLDRQSAPENRTPVALMGKVYCKVDAQYGAIETGDLLTTSETPAHAMRATDPLKAFGAVIGKALRPLTHGQGLIPILIALQ